MQLPTEIPTVMQNAATYFMMHGSEIPEYQRGRIIALMGPGISPVDFAVKTSELLYTVRDELSDAGLEVAAQAANLCAINNWHGMMDRGTRMVNALRRDAGEEVSQTPVQDPEVLTEYVEPVTTTEMGEPTVPPVE